MLWPTTCYKPFITLEYMHASSVCSPSSMQSDIQQIKKINVALPVMHLIIILKTCIVCYTFSTYMALLDSCPVEDKGIRVVSLSVSNFINNNHFIRLVQIIYSHAGHFIHIAHMYSVMKSKYLIIKSTSPACISS